MERNANSGISAALLGRARVYADVIQNKPVDYYDYESTIILFGDYNRYKFIREISRGKFSKVCEIVDSRTHSLAIVKALYTPNENKIKREYKILKNLSNGPNIVKLLDCIKDPTVGTPGLVLEHVVNDDYRQLFQTFSLDDIKFYIYELLKALDYSHSMGIMHRDVKPHNVVMNYKKRILRLIDWGLADFYQPGREYNVRVSCRYMKGPELLLGYTYYDYSLDMWAVGCMLGAMVLRQEPLFMGDDDSDQLVKIAEILGAPKLYTYIQKYGLSMDRPLRKKLQRLPGKHITELVNASNKIIASPLALDLTQKLLVYDHRHRLSAREAMDHPFFNSYINSRLEGFEVEK